jgi:hypothetical protein
MAWLFINLSPVSEPGRLVRPSKSKSVCVNLTLTLFYQFVTPDDNPDFDSENGHPANTR